MAMDGFRSDAFASRWKEMSLVEQLGNVGSEVERAFSWKRKGNDEFAGRAFDRSLELIDLTIGDPRWKGGKLKELTRLREFLCDLFLGDIKYGMTEEFFSRYFLEFAVAAQRGREDRKQKQKTEIEDRLGVNNA